MFWTTWYDEPDIAGSVMTIRPSGRMAWLAEEKKSFFPRYIVWSAIDPPTATPMSPLPSNGASTVSPLVRVAGGLVQTPVYCWTMRQAWLAVTVSAMAVRESAVLTTVPARATTTAVLTASLGRALSFMNVTSHHWNSALNSDGGKPRYLPGRDL